VSATKPDPVESPPDEGDVGSTVANAVVAGLRQDREEQKEARRKARRKPTTSKTRFRRGQVLLPHKGETAGDWALFLRDVKRYSGVGKMVANPGIWFPQTNRVMTYQKEGLSVATEVQRKRIRANVADSHKRLEALGAQPGRVFEPDGAVAVEEFSTYGVVRLRFAPGDLLVCDPEGAPGDSAEGEGRRDRGGYDDDWDSDAYPPRDVRSLRTWQRYAPALVWCYSPRYRLRLPFLATDLVEHTFDAKGLDRVVLPLGHRAHLLDLVYRPLHSDAAGRGVNILLFGPPGVGKTFTAVQLAEHTGRPLVTLDGRDLAGGPERFEARIKGVLQRADAWRAVVLCDEADVLLGKRGDSVGNAAFTVALLRLLDQHEGVVVLTSNRAFSIDDAFESRLHGRIFFPALCAGARTEVWRRTLADHGLDADWAVRRFGGDNRLLARCDLDGREVKLAVCNSLSRAQRAGRDVEAADVWEEASRLAADSIHLHESSKASVGFGAGQKDEHWEWE